MKYEHKLICDLNEKWNVVALFVSFAGYLWLRTGSRPTVGSSRIRSWGSCRSATAKDTLLCCPPLQPSNTYVSDHAGLQKTSCDVDQSLWRQIHDHDVSIRHLTDVYLFFLYKTFSDVHKFSVQFHGPLTIECQTYCTTVQGLIQDQTHIQQFYSLPTVRRAEHVSSVTPQDSSWYNERYLFKVHSISFTRLYITVKLTIQCISILIYQDWSSSLLPGSGYLFNHWECEQGSNGRRAMWVLPSIRQPIADSLLELSQSKLNQ